jgi:O-antigen ligase
MNLLSASNRDVTPEGPLHSGLSTTAESHAPYFCTTAAEWLLLSITVLLLPLESHILIVPGVSSMFLIFVVLAAYVAINRLRCLDRVWMHPVFVAAYVFIGVSLAFEFASPLSSYTDIGRFTLMIAGATLVASLCRDRVALKLFLYGYIGAALWLGVFLILTSYGTLSGASAEDFHGASLARAKAFEGSTIKGNINVMAFNCAQGGAVALAFAIACGSRSRRMLFFAIATFCYTASSFTLSRGGIAISLLSCAAILYASGLRNGRALFLVATLGACVFLLAPDALWSRMAFSMEGKLGEESRAVLYKKALDNWPDYISTGVGAGNFSNKWGMENGFVTGSGLNRGTTHTHNSFLQVTINWGLPGLLAFIAIIWQAYRCVPKRYGSDPLALSVLGIGVSLISLLLFTHNFYEKSFCLGLGILVAYQRWLGASKSAQPVDQ